MGDAPNPNVYNWSGGTVSVNYQSVIGEGRIANFGAGPCCLPLQVLQTAQEDLLNWNGIGGMSVMEMSHRGKHFQSIIDAAEADMRELLRIPKNFKVVLPLSLHQFRSIFSARRRIKPTTSSQGSGEK